MSLSTVWYPHFKFLSNFIKFTKREKVRFVKRVGKLAKFAIFSQDVTEARPQSVVLAAVREGNLTSPPGHADTQQPPWTSLLFRPIGSQCLWGLAM